MDFGARESFCFTVDLDAHPGGPWLYGRCCYWIGKLEVGDYSLGTSLRDVLFQMRWIVNDCGNRLHEAFFDQPANQVFQTLNEALFGSGHTENPDLPMLESWARFNVVIPVDVFDGWKVFLIDGEQSSRLIFADERTQRHIVRELILKKGIFDTCIQGAFHHLDRLYDAALTSGASEMPDDHLGDGE